MSIFLTPDFFFQSCQVEIIPERLQAYLFFLANHATENHDEEFLAAAIVSFVFFFSISIFPFFFWLSSSHFVKRSISS